jgi:protein TonB
MSKLIAKLLVSLGLLTDKDSLVLNLRDEKTGTIINISLYSVLMIVTIALSSQNIYPHIVTYVLGIGLIPAIIIGIIRLLFETGVIKQSKEDSKQVPYLIKKYGYVDIQKKYKMTFMLLGFIFVVGFLHLVMNWREIVEVQIFTQVAGNDFSDDEIEPPVTQHKPPPPPPPVVEIVAVPEEELIEEVEIEEIEIEEEEEVEEMIEEEPEEEEEEIFTIVEDVPEYPGGPGELFKFILGNVDYPVQAQESGISGTVYVRFTVDKDGSIKDVKVERSVHPLLDNAAKDVIASMPNWKPGKQRGKAVKVTQILPVKFTLGS